MRRPPTQQQETPGTRGFPDNQIKPTHSLSASDMLLYPLLPPSSVDWTSLWVTMKFWSMSTAEHIDERGKTSTLTTSPCPHLCFFALITGADPSLLIKLFIGSKWHPKISCCKNGLNWINLMSWSLIKIPLNWCQGEFSGGCPYLYVVLTCEWWFLHGLSLGSSFHNSSAYRANRKEFRLLIILR